MKMEASLRRGFAIGTVSPLIWFAARLHFTVRAPGHAMGGMHPATPSPSGERHISIGALLAALLHEMQFDHHAVEKKCTFVRESLCPDLVLSRQPSVKLCDVGIRDDGVDVAVIN
jgi:hypothetical protein